MAEWNVNDKARMSDEASEETVQAAVTELELLQQMLDTLKSVMYYLSRPMSVDWQTGRMKVQLESGTGASVNLNANQTLGTLTTLGTVSNLQWGITTTDEAYAMNRVSWNSNVGSKF